VATKIREPRKVTVDVAPDCDICAVEFTASPPQPARWEGPCGGPWANACEAHGSNLTVKVTEFVVEGGRA
jgi:hypothetical protein